MEVMRFLIKVKHITRIKYSFALLLRPVVNGTIFDLTGQANTNPEVLDQFTLLFLVIHALRNLFKYLTRAIDFEKVEANGTIGTLEMLRLRTDRTLEFLG